MMPNSHTRGDTARGATAGARYTPMNVDLCRPSREK